MTYMRGLVHGAVLGTIAGLCIAPQKGDQTRAQVAVAAARARQTAGRVQAALSRVAPIARSAVHGAGGAVGTVRSQVAKRGRHEANGAAPLTVESLRSS